MKSFIKPKIHDIAKFQASKALGNAMKYYAPKAANKPDFQLEIPAEEIELHKTIQKPFPEMSDNKFVTKLPTSFGNT